MGQTVVEKIAQAHLAEDVDGPVVAGRSVSIRPVHVMTHDNTAGVIARFDEIGATAIRDPSQPVVCLDHDVQNREPTHLARYAAIERFASRHGIDFYPAGTGIGHQLMVERLYVVPGSFVVAADSHANTYGALGAVGTPIVRSDAAAIWATGSFWWSVPPTVQVVLHGRLPDGATGKDVIVALAATYGDGEVLNAAVEFSGPGVATLDIDARLTISNMTTEWGALVGWFPADDVTRRFLRARGARPAADGIEPDVDAGYAGRIDLDMGDVCPHVAGPDTVRVATPVSRLEPRRIRIDKAYLVSCAGSRVTDLAAAAAVLRGKKVADGVELYVAAASQEIERDSVSSGDWQTLLDAGARPLPPGCGPCIGLGAGLLEAGEVGISATNRNFRGRMGSRDAHCYLSSPAVVAASAVAGRICGPGPPSTSSGAEPAYRFEPGAAPAPPARAGRLLPGFPERARGRLVVLTRDDLDTDGIYAGKYLYRDGMTAEAMARVVLENHDPTFARRVRNGDVLLGGRNFGCGSSREQAVTALQAAGVSLLIAASYSWTFLRNAFNNGFCCLTCPELSDHVRSLDPEARTSIPGDDVDIDYSTGTIHYGQRAFCFQPPGPVSQALVVDGGLTNQIRRRLGLD